MKVGDLVEVLSAEEILATLDENGEFENLPFMPEMLAFCGRRMTVHKVTHKLCDVIERIGLRRLDDAVILAAPEGTARCDGSAHGGCETACTLFWKTAWLKPATATAAAPARTTLPIVEINNTLKAPAEDGSPRYKCQATEILRAAPGRVKLKDAGQYVQDVRSGNAGVLAVLQALFFGLFNRYQQLSKRILPGFLRIRGGLRWGWVDGRAGRSTPVGVLDLKPGELVRIKSVAEINETLNADKLNRGMGFDEEMTRFCGRTARVSSRVERCLDERTGELLVMKTPCVILEGLACEGVFSGNCPREYVPFWREIWLERVDDGS